MPAPAHTLVLDLSASLFLGIVGDGGRVLSRRVQEQVRGEAAHGLLEETLAEAGIGPGDLSAIAIGAGPGSFTGIRVGVALAQGLAFARRLPLYPYSSLEAMRACAGASAPGSAPAPATLAAIAAIAANAGRYYVSLGEPPREALMSGADLLERASGETLVVSGPLPERERLAAVFPAILRLEDIFDFARVAALALSRPPVRDGVIRPNYLMASAAEEKRAAGGGPAAGEPAAGGAGG